MTKAQQSLSGFTTLAVAVTRIWVRSHSMWDWDEALFTAGVRSYDVSQHHPHPPGFPLYIAMAKLVRMFVHSDFHALQAVTTLAAIALFPLLVWLALELRFPFRTAYLGALLCVFLPNVWYYGGTAFSDIPQLALTIAACAALLRGRESTRWYLAGALLLGLAAAMRPQALLIGLVPAILATRKKRVRDVLAAAATGIVVIAVSYGGAALASSSPRDYFDATRAHSQYIRDVDSFHNPNRTPLLRLFPDFFVHAIPGRRAALLVSVFALIALLASFLQRDRRVWICAAMFLPFNVFAWFMLDVNGISRFATSWAPMNALLAVHAIEALIVLIWRRSSQPAIAIVQSVLVLAALTGFVTWSLPALRDIRRTDSPTVAAMEWIVRNAPRAEPVYVHGSMGPFANVFIPGRKVVLVGDDLAELRTAPAGPGDWFVRNGSTSVLDGHNFVRNRRHMIEIERHTYYEVSVAPLSELLQFGAGWYGSESYGTREWRWMGRSSVTMLPPVEGNARLALAFDIPSELVAQHPNVEVRLNGQMIDRIVCTSASMSKSWIVPARPDTWNQLDLSVDRVLNPAKAGITPDPRDLGLMLTSYAWTPVVHH